MAKTIAFIFSLMSKFRITQIIFFLLLIGGFAIGNFFLITGIIFVFIAIVSFGSFNIQSNFHLTAINKVVNNENKIVLSFDDGPNKNITPKVLDILKEYNCKAVFFCIGKNIIGNEYILQRIYNEGHLIGNHSYSHSYWFDLFPSKKMQDEIKQTNDLIFAITADKNNLFRPPYGVTNPMLAKAIKRENMLTIGWNKRSLDTVIKNIEKVIVRITKNLKSGDIILLHDHLENAPQILKEFLEEIKKTNLKVERLDKLIK